MIPKTIEQAFTELDNMLQQDDKQYIIDNGSISVHNTLGRWIRNNWNLWDEEPNDLKSLFLKIGISHPDDMSDHIIKWYIHHLNQDDEFYKKEMKIIKDRNKQDEPNISLDLMKRIAHKSVGFNIAIDTNIKPYYKRK